MRSNILAFVVGVWLLQQQPVLPGPAWGGLLPVVLLAAWRLPAAAGLPLALARRALWGGFFLVLGFFWAALLAGIRLSDALPPQWEGKDVQLVGVVARLPRRGGRGTRFEFDVGRVLTPRATVPRHIQLTWYSRGFRGRPQEVAHDIRPGQRWRLTVRLKRPHGNANPYGFDYEAWLLERDVRATGYVRRAHDNRLMADLVPRPGYLVERLREHIARHMERVLGERPYAGVLEALAVGERGAITPPQWQVLLRTGVNHLMSISGLHVSLVSGLVFALAYWLWRLSPRLTRRLPARKAAVLAGLGAALCYALLAGFAIPAQRAFYMLAVVAAALWWGRMGSASTVLCLALLAVVVPDPWAVLAPGFWLSFAAVAAIVFAGTGRIGRRGRLCRAASAQWAVALGLIPALLVLFRQVSVVSPLANAIAIPVVSLGVVPLTLAGALLPLDFPLLAAHALMSGCMRLLGWLSTLPVAVWQQHAPLAWTVPVAALAVVWLLLPRGFPARWVGLLGLAPLFLAPLPGPRQGALWVTVLDVGQGLAVVARTRHHTLLYDAGPRFGGGADSGNRIILPYLRGSGVTRLDGLVVSHDDVDHSGGAISVLDGIPTAWLDSSLPHASPIPSHAGRSLRCVSGQHWAWDGVRFETLHPDAASYGVPHLKDNARGCVLKIVSPYGSVLLPADIERGTEALLLERRPQALASTVLVAPHHGSGHSSSPAFVRRVAPAVVVFSVGYRNPFGHPRKKVVRRYRAMGARLYRTDRGGAVELRFDGPGGVTVRPFRKMERRYWRAQ